MPSDYGHEQTDKELKRLEEKINKEYEQAAKEVQEKFYAHMKDFERIDAKMKAKVNAGKITETEYQNWRTNQMLTGQRMNALFDNLAKDLVNADQIAAGMINDSLPNVYALNMNYSTYKIEHTTEIDTNFTLYDRKTVENLMKDNPRIIPQLTPKQKEKIAKDELWNRQHLVSAVAQGILQGEGIPDIAKRLQTVAAMDDNAATRNARTYITAAQNKGRIDSYERAEKLGIKTNKKWIATLDDRTRVEHRHLDGVSIPYSDLFKMDGYEIEYPGDPSAEPEMIYNCFIGDTSAYTNCEVIRSYAHQYDGYLIEIKTASGVNFTCTPNHPILTLNGWVSAASLHNGDDLLVTRIGNKFGFGRYCNIQHVFSSMKTFHDSFKRNGTIERNSALSVNFHGDVPTSEVEIVTQKRFLSNNGYSSICKSVKKFLLKFSDKTLFCKCTFMEHFRSVWLSTLGDIRHRSKLLSFFKRHLGHSEVHRLRPIALFDASGVKPLQNDVSGNIERISDCLNGFSGIVFADNIVNVNISSKCTHVYNLQTENGYYFVNSIISQKNKRYNDVVAISHNCRCTLVDDILDWPYNDERNDSKLGDMTYEEWKHAKDKQEKEEAKVEPISNITFSDRVNDETKELILKLEEQYNTRLGEVTIGSEKGAGDVDIAGYYMRLSSQKPDVVLHEFAHTLANSSADKYGLTNDAEFWKEIDKVKREYRKDVGQDTTRWISSYEHSTNDKDEFLAEAFTMAKMKEMGIEMPDKYGDDFTYSDRVLEIVDKYFGKEVESEEKQEEPAENKVVQGKDITLTWERRKEEFDFEIEDIINAQGFDGLPKVVNAEEFEKAVKESNFIAQRTYSATDEETLKAYQDSLYNGKWYVDCSVGGSAHGKGMYSAANYNGELSDEIKQEMKDYIGQNKQYTSQDAPYIIETFTIDPSANFLELPKGIDDEDYVFGMFSNKLFLEKSTEKGLKEEAQKVIDLNLEKSKNYNEYLNGKITSEELWAKSDKLNEKINEIVGNNKDLKDARMEAVKTADKVKDIGSMAALMGYDGLHTHYGTCGNDTIILNRTKLIFKGE